jgi:hypothetical protein
MHQTAMRVRSTALVSLAVDSVAKGVTRGRSAGIEVTKVPVPVTDTNFFERRHRFVLVHLKYD